jgi:hypothetical protein
VQLGVLARQTTDTERQQAEFVRVKAAAHEGEMKKLVAVATELDRVRADLGDLKEESKGSMSCRCDKEKEERNQAEAWQQKETDSLPDEMMKSDARGDNDLSNPRELLMMKASLSQ